VDYQQLGFSMTTWEAWIDPISIGRRAVAELAVSGLEKELP
jgi:hypothetical protein